MSVGQPPFLSFHNGTVGFAETTNFVVILYSFERICRHGGMVRRHIQMRNAPPEVTATGGKTERYRNAHFSVRFAAILVNAAATGQAPNYLLLPST